MNMPYMITLKNRDMPLILNVEKGIEAIPDAIRFIKFSIRLVIIVKGAASMGRMQPSIVPINAVIIPMEAIGIATVFTNIPYVGML